MEVANVYNGSWRVARKDHKCISGCKIKKGSRYYITKILYDGDWTTEKYCEDFNNFIDSYNSSVDWDQQIHAEQLWDVDWELSDMLKLHVIFAKNEAPFYLRERVSHYINILRLKEENRELYDKLRKIKQIITRPDYTNPEDMVRQIDGILT